MSVCVTGWTSECIHIGSAFSLCVRLPATSIQQQRITGPDVCDLWSGRSCGGEASNVLNIISHRWSLKRALQHSHTHIRTPTSPFIPDHSAVFAGRMCVCQASNRDSPCADLAGAFANRIFQFGRPGGLVPYGCGWDPAGTVVDGGRPFIFHTRKALTSEGWWTEKKT